MNKDRFNMINICQNIFKAICILLICCPPPLPCQAAGSDSLVTTFSTDGAWCWFQDPRAVYIEGRQKQLFAGWVTDDGKLQVGSYNLELQKAVIVTIKEDWGADDHNTCSFLVLPDKKIMVFYAQHNQKGLFCRTSSAPEDITKWEEEVTITDSPRVTYSHPVYLEEEKRFYVFWRGESWKPTFSMSEDGKTWSTPEILIQEESRAAKNIRPYIKITSDGKSSIHFAFTDGHPRNEPLNSIYYLKYEHGIFTHADGKIAGFYGRLPIAPSRSDCVYNGHKTGIRAWVWDIALDKSGNPVIAYTRLPCETDHRYHYACWTGSEWLDTEITSGGKWFPQTPPDKKETESYYSGGMALDPTSPDIIYLSRPVNGIFEIEKWTTPDAGRHWSAQPITAHSGTLNVRPVVPRYCPPTLSVVLWMNGSYIHYTDFNTRIKLYTVSD